jgi:hypothetical protein
MAAEKDEEYRKIQENCQIDSLTNKESKFSCIPEGLILYKNIVFVPNNAELKNLILGEAHKKPYSAIWVSKDNKNIKERIFLA